MIHTRTPGCAFNFGRRMIDRFGPDSVIVNSGKSPESDRSDVNPIHEPATER